MWLVIWLVRVRHAQNSFSSGLSKPLQWVLTWLYGIFIVDLFVVQLSENHPFHRITVFVLTADVASVCALRRITNNNCFGN